jgi:hypothetical protein
MNLEKIKEVVTHYIGWTSIEHVRVDASINADSSVDVMITFPGGREHGKELAGSFWHGFFIKPDGFWKITNRTFSAREGELSTFDFTMKQWKADLSEPVPPVLTY